MQIAALLIKIVFGPADGDQATALVAFTLFAVPITFCVATIPNDNLRDVKTGQWVRRRYRVALQTDAGGFESYVVKK